MLPPPGQDQQQHCSTHGDELGAGRAGCRPRGLRRPLRPGPRSASAPQQVGRAVRAVRQHQPGRRRRKRRYEAEQAGCETSGVWSRTARRRSPQAPARQPQQARAVR